MTTATYTGTDDVASVTDSLGRVTPATYDPAGRHLAVLGGLRDACDGKEAASLLGSAQVAKLVISKARVEVSKWWTFRMRAVMRAVMRALRNVVPDASGLLSLSRTSSEKPRYVWETMRGFVSTRPDSTAYRQVLFPCFLDTTQRHVSPENLETPASSYS